MSLKQKAFQHESEILRRLYKLVLVVIAGSIMGEPGFYGPSVLIIERKRCQNELNDLLLTMADMFERCMASRNDSPTSRGICESRVAHGL